MTDAAHPIGSIARFVHFGEVDGTVVNDMGEGVAKNGTAPLEVIAVNQSVRSYYLGTQALATQQDNQQQTEAVLKPNKHVVCFLLYIEHLPKAIAAWVSKDIGDGV